MHFLSVPFTHRAAWFSDAPPACFSHSCNLFLLSLVWSVKWSLHHPKDSGKLKFFTHPIPTKASFLPFVSKK
jgi:hypothetical protein